VIRWELRRTLRDIACAVDRWRDRSMASSVGALIAALATVIQLP